MSTKLDQSVALKTFKFLYEHQEALLMTCAIFKKETNEAVRGESELASGLYDQHAYSLLRLEMVKNLDAKVVRLLQVRNPWGDEKEFRGKWSDNSAMWETLPQETRDQLRSIEPDGTFWIEYADWIENFDQYGLCLLPLETYGGYVGNIT